MDFGFLFRAVVKLFGLAGRTRPPIFDRFGPHFPPTFPRVHWFPTSKYQTLFLTLHRNQILFPFQNQLSNPMVFAMIGEKQKLHGCTQEVKTIGLPAIA